MLFWYYPYREPGPQPIVEDSEAEASARRWQQISPLIWLDRRVVDYVDDRSMRWIVWRVVESHHEPVTRVEVIPYQWSWDENFYSVLMRFYTAIGKFSMVWALSVEKVERTVLAPYEGPVAN